MEQEGPTVELQVDGAGLSSDGYFQQDNAPFHKAQIISDWFLEPDNKLTVLQWPPQSPDLNPVEHNGKVSHFNSLNNLYNGEKFYQ